MKFLIAAVVVVFSSGAEAFQCNGSQFDSKFKVIAIKSPAITCGKWGVPSVSTSIATNDDCILEVEPKKPHKTLYMIKKHSIYMKKKDCSYKVGDKFKAKLRAVCCPPFKVQEVKCSTGHGAEILNYADLSANDLACHSDVLWWVLETHK